MAIADPDPIPCVKMGSKGRLRLPEFPRLYPVRWGGTTAVGSPGHGEPSANRQDRAGEGSPPSCPVEFFSPPPPTLSRAFLVQNRPSLGWHFSRGRDVGKTYASSTDHTFRAFAPLSFSRDTRGDISLAWRCQTGEQRGYVAARAEQRRSVYSALGKDADAASPHKFPE